MPLGDLQSSDPSAENGTLGAKLMGLWRTRDAAILALTSEMREEAALMCEVFDLIDDCARCLGEIDTPFAQVTGLTLVKARHLGLACYDLDLNGLAQEAGALLRVLIEALELLTYFLQEPSRSQQALDQTLPEAGRRAQMIDGHFRGVREYLNEHASHVGWSKDSMRHLFDTTTMCFRLDQQFDAAVLRENLQVLFAVLVFTAIEGINCLRIADGLQQDELADRAERLKREGIDSFVRLVQNRVEGKPPVENGY